MKKISVIGVGKLGLCFSLGLEKVGYSVLGVDVSREYVDKLNQKSISSFEPFVEKYLKESTNFEATTDMSNAVKYSDVIFVVVATPSLENGRYDHTQVDEVVSNLKVFGKQKNTKELIICCTTMPTYCDEISKFLKDYNYNVSYNPEFIAQGSIMKDQSNPDMILIGEASAKSGDIIQEIHQNLAKNEPKYHRMTRTEAEITKLSLNCFLTTKIAYTNMIGDIVKSIGGRPEVVLEAIGSDSRIGNKYLRYGFGYGGPCFPRDNRALALFADDLDMPADISLATDRLNKKHLNFQVKSFTENYDKEEPIFFDGAGTNIGGEMVFEGITYKRGTTIIEESQQLLFAAQLAKFGYDVIIIDYEETILQVQEIYEDLFHYEVIND